MWYHGAGNEVEAKIVNQIIADFNASQADWKVEMQSFPQAAYNDSVVAGALAGNLPDILDVDGPVMPNWAWSGLHAAAADRRSCDCQLPARTQGILGRQALLHRPVGCRRRAGDPPGLSGRAGPAHADAGAALDGRRIHGRAGRGQGIGQVRICLRSRHGLDWRMVSLRLLAVPAVLRRRHRGPYHLQDGRRRAERRGCAEVRRMVAGSVHQWLCPGIAGSG